jgi:polyphosphate kinase 2 (PPK2 family)
VIFQAMDAAGKDGAIEHVFSGVNPLAFQVFSFKQPSTEELDHDYLWRTSCRLPERGRIGLFNRSYYEEVLVVRVHPQILAGQRLPPKLVTKRIWEERLEDIAAFERYLTRQGFWCSSSFSTSRGRNSGADFYRASRSPRRTGNSRSATCASASTGTPT